MKRPRCSKARAAGDHEHRDERPTAIGLPAVPVICNIFWVTAPPELLIARDFLPDDPRMPRTGLWRRRAKQGPRDD
jgi:hypothetical protein